MISDGGRLLPRHLRAMQDSARCRTETLGGPVSHGEPCREDHDRSHSCQHRHGPKCPPDPAEPWLDNPKRLLRPLPHGMVTVTRPDALSELARRPPKTLDNLLLRRASEA